MILLDTNAISEPWRPVPDPRVLAWFDAQTIETLFIAAITVAELRFGVATLPPGRRRSDLQDRLEGRLLPLFVGRIVPFDLAASAAYADLMGRARAVGRPIAQADGYIAATAAARGMMVATRDRAPFEAAGVTVIDPWQGVAPR